MRTISNILAIAALAIAVSSCGSGRGDHIPASVGATYEVTVISTQEKWEGALGDTIREILRAPVDYINDNEPLFDIVRILPDQFKGLLPKSRNILNLTTGADYTSPAMTVQYDLYAAPQIIVTLSGPDNASITEYVSTNRESLQNIFHIAERDRAIAMNERYGEPQIESRIRQKFGFDMHLNRGYMIRNDKPDHFMWISFEYPTASQGVVIYSYPYHGRENFTVDSLVANRNRFVSLIPAQNEGSHMTTAEVFIPEIFYRRINGRFWAEMRGFWDAKGDWMGGPFVSYSTLDTSTNRVVTLDFYVYSPIKPKRNYIRSLENLIYSVEFPGDRTPAEQ